MEIKMKFYVRERVTKQMDKPHASKDAERLWIELNNMRRRGDFTLAGEIVGISAQNTLKAFERVGSKYHEAVVQALDKIINNRLKLIEQGQKININ